MKAIYVLLGITLLLTIDLYSQRSLRAETIEPEWVLVQTPLRWKSPPANAGVQLRGTSRASVLVLYPNGEYAAVSCLLIKQKNGTVTISNGDGHVVRIGTWNQNGRGEIIAVSTVVFRTISVLGENRPEPTVVEEFTERAGNGKRQLRVGPLRYEPLLQFVDLTHLSTLVDISDGPRGALAAMSGAVPDAVTATRLAERALSKVYGKGHIEREKPFNASLFNGIWTVGGTLYCGQKHGYVDTDLCFGGVATAEIRQSDGHLLRVWHTK